MTEGEFRIMASTTERRTNRRRRNTLVQDRKNGPRGGRCLAWHRLMRATLAIGAIGAGLPAFGENNTLYDETRVLQHANRECAAAANCRTISGAQITLNAGQSQNMTVRCPAEAPYFVGWDTEQNEHIQAILLPLPAGAEYGRPVPTGRRMVISTQNVGTGPGGIAVFLGCSTDATPPTGMMRQRLSVPGAFVKAGVVSPTQSGASPR